MNSGSVAEQRALSRLTDQEHEASTWCSLDIVSVIWQSLLLSCERYHIWHLWGFSSEKPNYKICSRCGCCTGTGIHIGHKGKYFMLMKSKCIFNYKSASNRLFLMWSLFQVRKRLQTLSKNIFHSTLLTDNLLQKLITGTASLLYPDNHSLHEHMLRSKTVQGWWECLFAFLCLFPLA